VVCLSATSLEARPYNTGDTRVENETGLETDLVLT
jgi:hypothetical protein